MCVQGTCEACGGEGETCCSFVDEYFYGSNDEGSTIDDAYFQYGGPECFEDELQCVDKKCV